MARAVKEAIYIRVNNPTLNRNIGKYNLPHLWDGLLQSIPELKNKQMMTLHYNICATRVIMPSTTTSVHMGQISEFTEQHSLHHNICANKKIVYKHNENK